MKLVAQMTILATVLVTLSARSVGQENPEPEPEGVPETTAISPGTGDDAYAMPFNPSDQSYFNYLGATRQYDLARPLGFGRRYFSVGGTIAIPTTGEGEPLAPIGGGVTFGLEGQPWFTRQGMYRGVELAPVFNVDIGGHTFNEHVQLDYMGTRWESDGVFGVHFRPGMRARTPVSNNLDFWLDGRFAVGYNDANLRSVTLDPAKFAVPVVHPKSEDWPIGYAVGAGIERITLRGNSIRPGVFVKGCETDLFTGANEWHTEIMVTIEVTLNRRPIGGINAPVIYRQ